MVISIVGELIFTEFCILTSGYIHVKLKKKQKLLYFSTKVAVSNLGNFHT